MAQAIQDNPEIGAVLQGYQQGDYDGLLNSQAALQALADSTGVSVDVIITRITQELRAKGATDGQLVAIDQDASNRKDVIKTTAHELDHVRDGSSETLANLAGIAADLNVSASMDANQDEIDSYKPALGNGKDAITQAENKQLLDKNDITLITAVENDPESFDYAVSWKQEFQYLGRFVDNDTAKAYMAIDKSQEQAHFKGSQAALKEFGENIVNAPANIKALYQATKDDPIAVAIEIGKALKNLPPEYYNMGKDITYASLLGNKDQDFYDAGKASTAIALEAATAIISSGGAVVVKKVQGRIVGVEIKPPSRNPDRKPDRSNSNADYNANNSNNPNSNNKSNSQNTTILGNDNYFDNFNNDAPDTRDYTAELQATKDKQKAASDKYDAQMQAENAKRDAEWIKMQAETDALLAESNKVLREAEADVRVNDKIAEADRIKDDFNRSKANRTSSINSSTNGVNSTPNTTVINGITYYNLPEGGYTTTKPSSSTPSLNLNTGYNQPPTNYADRSNSTSGINNVSNNNLIADPTSYKGVRDPLYQPPEHPDYPITSYIIPDEGLTVNMAIHKNQIDPKTGQVLPDRIGGYTTKDDILNVEQVHSDLAVKSPDWGPEKTHIQQIQILPGTRVQESVVGPQKGSDGKIYEGGGNQVVPLVKPDDRSKVMIPIGTAIPLPKKK